VIIPQIKLDKTTEFQGIVFTKESKNEVIETLIGKTTIMKYTPIISAL